MLTPGQPVLAQPPPPLPPCLSLKNVCAITKNLLKQITHKQLTCACTHTPAHTHIHTHTHLLNHTHTHLYSIHLTSTLLLLSWIFFLWNRAGRGMGVRSRRWGGGWGARHKIHIYFFFPIFLCYAIDAFKENFLSILKISEKIVIFPAYRPCCTQDRDKQDNSKEICHWFS